LIIARALPTEVAYALTNLVCCFPAEAKARGDNEPEQNEIDACRMRLIEFINLAEPRLIVCVGILAGDNVDHGAGVKCVDIVHPAAILKMAAPKAQKDDKINRVIVTLRSAVDDMLESEPKPFVPWRKSDAGKRTQVGTRSLRNIADTTSVDAIYRPGYHGPTVNDDDIPF
jgi:hypothetical protein